MTAMILADDLTNVLDLLAAYPHRWAVCGGWAIDLFLGETTREHKDIDIAIPRRDQLAMQSFLAERGWSLEKAAEGKLIPWQAGEEIALPVHTIWCKHPAFRPDFIEILFNEVESDLFRFRRDQSITRPVDQAFIELEGVPILAPEIVLLYKSNNTAHEGKAADFLRAAPLLGAERQAWLRAALERTAPGHEWLAPLR